MGTEMTVQEYQLVGKEENPLTCEDDVIITDAFVAVVDGATSQVRSSEKSPGLKAVNCVREALEGMPGDIDAIECFERLNSSIADIYREEGVYEKAKKYPEYRSSAAGIIYSRFRSEIWLIGDCQGLIDDRVVADWKGADSLLSDVRAMYLESEILKGKSIDELRAKDTGREYIRELLIRQKLFQNSGSDSPYAYTVLDGFLTDAQGAVRIYSVPETCKRIVLASDGYPSLKPTLLESERVLHEIISADPLCFRDFKSTKGVYSGNVSFDDRAYVRLEALSRV